MMSKLLFKSLNSINKSSLINLRKFHSIKAANQSKFYFNNQNSFNQNKDGHNLKLNLLSNKNKFNLFLNQYRYESTGATKTLTEAVKSSVDSIKQIDSKEIDLSDFQIPNLPTPEEIVMLKSALTANDLGLTHWAPTGLLFSLFDTLYKLGVEWPVTIIVSTILIRTIITPVMISSRRQSVELGNFMSKFKKYQEEVETVQLRGNIMDMNRLVLKYQDIIEGEESKKILNRSKLTYFKMPIVQLFLFTSFFITLRKMCYYPVPSLHEASFLWLPSLAEKDPYYILPIITSGTLFLTLRLGVEFGSMGMNLNKFQKAMFYGLPLFSLFITYNFPSALCLYWCTANLHSLLTTYILNLQSVKKYLNLPEMANKKEIEEERKLNLSSILKFKDAVTTVKDSYKKHKLKNNIKNIDKSDQDNFEKAGSGPLRKTYKYNPKDL